MTVAQSRLTRAILINGGCIAALFALYCLHAITWDDHIGLAGVVAICGFVYGVFEIRSIFLQNRAAFIRDYISKFFSDDLYSIYHSLIYTYSDHEYDRAQKLFRESYPDGEIPAVQRPQFTFLESLQGERTPGNRLYHPKAFQRSFEERNLDRLLGYFDIVGYYHAKGLIEIDDIVTALGYYLAVLDARKVTKDYIDESIRVWQTLPYQQQTGCEPPFQYLHALLRAVRAHNARKATKHQNRTTNGN